ncbi:MAG: hypothetical protein V7K35_17770 [Nostoc sp.]
MVEPFDIAASPGLWRRSIPSKKLIGGRCCSMFSSHPESSKEFQ